MAEKFQEQEHGKPMTLTPSAGLATNLPFNPRPAPLIIKDQRDIRQFAIAHKRPHLMPAIQRPTLRLA
ncbi:MAG: hypothetical protein AB8B88_04950, partial [Devosiaceae bacterium]